MPPPNYRIVGCARKIALFAAYHDASPFYDHVRHGERPFSPVLLRESVVVGLFAHFLEINFRRINIEMHRN